MRSDRSEPVHVMDVVKEELDARGWTLEYLAMRIAGHTNPEYGICLLALQMLDAVREPNVILGEQAEELGRAFGVSPDFFRNLHENWREWRRHSEAESHRVWEPETEGKS